MGGGDSARTLVVTAVASDSERAGAALMIDSLRAFGGPMAAAPVVVFDIDPASAPRAIREAPGVEVRAVPDEPFGRYVLARKVAACARAEALAPAGASLAWLNPDVLVVGPPVLLDVGGAFDAALRPVHVRNVGNAADAPLDGYWRGICEVAGVADIGDTVEPFVDGGRIRAYFNTHAFAVAAAARLCARWRACFAALVADAAFQAGACADAPHRLFLHQAVLAAVVAAAVPPGRLRALPPDYAYPYNLHASVPATRRARALDDLVCVACEDRPLDPAVVDDIAIGGRLRAWLAARVGGG